MAHQPSSPGPEAAPENGAATAEPPRPAPPERRGSGFVNFFANILGSKNPIALPADPHKNTVWLLDSTAYQPVADAPAPDHTDPTPWQAELVACIFETEGRKDVGKLIAAIADHIGLDGELGGADDETRQRMVKRVQPFLDHVSPGRTLTLEIPIDGKTQTVTLGPSDRNGIISQTVNLEASDIEDGAAIHPQIKDFSTEAAGAGMGFAAPEGWLVVSDIDDTIKHTMTPEPSGILRTTFAEEPVAIPGMPEFYRHVHDELNPAWFYVSASPYNLYPFLHDFLHAHYHPGTLILRDYSWMDITGLMRSFTERTHEYKVDRLEKIRRWFPRRRVLCVGDSTQSDPEAYADMYQRYPGWIHAIVIRKVTDAVHMEEKNKRERFERAFKDVPAHVWKVFEDPGELYDFADGLGMEDEAL